VVNLSEFWRKGPNFTLSIPASAKPGLYARMRGVMQSRSLPAALAAVAGLAVVVNAVELLCTAGLPAVYTAVLSQQNLGLAAHYGYLGLYIVGYIADDALMVGFAVPALSSNKLGPVAEAHQWCRDGGPGPASGASARLAVLNSLTQLRVQVPMSTTESRSEV